MSAEQGHGSKSRVHFLGYSLGSERVDLNGNNGKSAKRMVVKSKNRSRSGSDFYFLLSSRDDCYLTFSTEAIVPSKGSTSDNAPV